ncbi:MAG TPA: Gfo/Idh/MocA family oxidoreductase [Bryobacteraceae bacterium]|nr:Gfo/Idh/MocA family oxidoreductase [Bryobacteraceae bacterium]
MEHRLRGVVVGCGAFSEYHLRAWERIPEVEIVALVDGDPAAAERRRAATAPEARIYADFDAAIECENLDFADILSPAAQHMDHCLAAKAAGLHMVCRQPLCGNLPDARRLVAAMSDYSHVFDLHASHRYGPWFRRVKELHCAGMFGRVALLRFDEAHAGEGGSGPSDAGVWLQCGTALVDMMRDLLGEPAGVYSRMHQLDPRITGESMVHAVYEYPTTTAIVHLAWNQGEPARGAVALEGDGGAASYEAGTGHGTAARLKISERGVAILDDERSHNAEYEEGFYAFQRELTKAMLGRTAALHGGEDHLKTLECTFAAYRSAAEGLPVGL